jgi:hypothetical protein
MSSDGRYEEVPEVEPGASGGAGFIVRASTDAALMGSTAGGIPASWANAVRTVGTTRESTASE